LRTTTVNVAEDKWEYLGRFALDKGTSTLQLATDKTAFFPDLGLNYSKKYGSCEIEDNIIKTTNTTAYPSQQYNNFDLNLEFKPIQFGEENWNGPEIRLASTDTYVRLIFHKDGHLEIARQGQKYDPGVVEKQTGIKFDSWTNLRVIKIGNTSEIYLDGEHLLTYPDPLLNKLGKIEIGSDGGKSINSTTYYKDVAVSEDVVTGLWLLPVEDRNYTQTTLTELGSETYRLQINQTRFVGTTLVLGENYEPRWEATFDGVALPSHTEANMYANCWFINTSEGIHDIEIHYTTGNLYRVLLYFSVSSVGVLLLAVYFPINALRKIRGFLNRILRPSKQGKNGTAQPKA
jgi:hypothetical protein